MSKLKLHEAIIATLKTFPEQTASYHEIAHYINLNRLYVRKDFQDVPEFQIKLRVTLSNGRYSKYFRVHKERVQLIRDAKE